MAAQLKVIEDDKAKGKSSVKAQGAADELTYLRNFNQSITWLPQAEDEICHSHLSLQDLHRTLAKSQD